MAKRQRVWAANETFRLRFLLGDKCVRCGTSEELVFDVKVPCDNGSHHKKEWSWRMSFYRKQFSEGNLQLLCNNCNAVKGANEDYANIPF